MEDRNSSAQALRSAAARPVFERIDALAKSAAGHPRIAAMLVHIRKNLFEPSLTVASLKVACNVRDNSAALVFHRTIGQPPHAFISECRLEVAERMLSSTSLPVWRLAELLGYSSIQVFSRAFWRTRRRRPLEIRKEARGRGSIPAPVAAPEPAFTGSANLLEEALAGRLDPEAAGELIWRLLDIYLPESKRLFAVVPSASSLAAAVNPES